MGIVSKSSYMQIPVPIDGRSSCRTGNSAITSSGWRSSALRTQGRM